VTNITPTKKHLETIGQSLLDECSPHSCKSSFLQPIVSSNVRTSDTGGCDERNTFCASAPALFTPGQYTTTSIVGINSGVRKHLNLLTPSFPLRRRKPIRNPRKKKRKGKKNRKKSHKQTRKRTKTANLCSEKGPLH
jgi:hypothetical protein